MSISIPEIGIYTSILIFIVGFCGLMFRKNIVFMMLSIELMLNSANLAFISASQITHSLDGQVMMFFVIAIAACEAGIGLAFIMALYRLKSTVEVDELRVLRG